MKLKAKEFLYRMELAGETKSSLCAKCNISRQAISAWLCGSRNPKAGKIATIAKILHCSVSDIAVPQTELEVAAASGDKFAVDVLEKHPASSADDFQKDIENYIAKKLIDAVRLSNQSEVARRIGLSPSQVNRLYSGQADLSLFPVGAFLKLCPELIDGSVLYQTSPHSAEERQRCHELIDALPDAQISGLLALLQTMVVK